MMNSSMEEPVSGEEEALDSAPEYDARFRDAVEAGIAEADRGDLLDHDEVVERIERIEQEHAAELIRQRDNAEQDFREGRSVPWEQIKRENGLRSRGAELRLCGWASAQPGQTTITPPAA